MKYFFLYMFNFLRIKINTLLSFFRIKKKKPDVLFCEETQRVINKKLAKKLDKNIVRFKLEKNRPVKSGEYYNSINFGTENFGAMNENQKQTS